MAGSNGYIPDDPDLFVLDPNRLDMEWGLQARFYRKEAEKMADLRRKFEEAKADRDVALAEMSQKVRTNPAVYGLEKTTEASVGEVVTAKTRKVEQSVIEAQHDYDVQKALVEAIDHRKSALENLVKLRLAAYYADPQMPKGVSPEEVEAAMDCRPQNVSGKKRR